MSFQPMSMTEDQAPEMLKTQDDQSVLPIQFIKVEEYTTFRAEFAFDGDDIVFHFFLPPELEDLQKKGPSINQRVDKYWKDSFPRTLDVVARDFFKVEFPRLKAAYTEELQSWWLRAFGFSDGLDPEARCRMFIARLDQALDAVNVNHRLV